MPQDPIPKQTAITNIYIIEERFRSKTSDNMERWNAEERMKSENEETEWRERRCICAKRYKIAIQYVFPIILGSGGSKSTQAKAAGAKPPGQRRDDKLNAMLARSTFPNQNVQNTPHSEHLWKFGCRKSARRCGAKHISKSKMCKTSQRWTTFGQYDVEKVHAIVARSTISIQDT